jgi:hypothetical protein
VNKTGSENFLRKRALFWGDSLLGWLFARISLAEAAELVPSQTPDNSLNNQKVKDPLKEAVEIPAKRWNLFRDQ